jgi:hypothetical protein
MSRALGLRLLLRVVVLACSGFALACGPTLSHPPYTTQPPGALVLVDQPPPPARVEILPARPDESVVWIDGEWTWRRGRWAWMPGRWVVPPKGAKYSAWTFVRGSDGELWYAPGVWRDATGAALAPPPAQAVASVEGGDVVSADGSASSTGPTLRPVSPERDGPRASDGK